MKLTALEKKVIQVYKEDQYVGDVGWESDNACTWTEYFAEDCEMSGKVFSGVMSSLSQKGLIWTNNEAFGLTAEGIKVAHTV